MPPRLSRLASLLLVLVCIGIALLLLVPSLGWLDPTLVRDAMTPRVNRLDLSPADRLAGWALAMPPYAVVALGLAQLAVFCQRVRQRRVFTAAAATALRRFGWSLILASMLLPISKLGLSFLFADAAQPGLILLSRPVPILPAALGMTLGLVFVVFAAILGEAARLAEENAGFI